MDGMNLVLTVSRENLISGCKMWSVTTLPASQCEENAFNVVVATVVEQHKASEKAIAS